MEWIEGRTLSEFVQEHFGESERLMRLAETFAEMIATLQRAGVAHGDLQHGNILVIDNDRLRLVDYDGMYVPALKGQSGRELGHRNYQHPHSQRA